MLNNHFYPIGGVGFTKAVSDFLVTFSELLLPLLQSARNYKDN